MKGVIFNLLEELVTRHQGEAAWDAVLLEAGVDGVYTSLGSYPDEDLVRLVEAVEGAAACFEEQCPFEHAARMLRGDPQGIFRVRFQPLPPTP